MRIRYLLLLSLLFSIATSATAETKLLRFPDLHGDTVVFTYAGDLWTAPAAGGTATRLTAHPGVELFAKFSPDGQWIAFTGQYDGDEQVFVIPARGGEPRQLTFYPANGPLPPRWGYDNQVYGWTPDGSAVLFRSMRDGWDLSDTKLYTVAVSGGLPTALPMPESGGGDLSADHGKVVYSPVTRDFRHWKRYEGGWAQNLYIFDLATNEATQITDHPRTERDPMWIGDTIYFSSDADGTLELYAYDVASGTQSQLTRDSAFDIRWPSADHGTGRIVYELGGGLTIFDTATSARQAIAITVPDDALASRPHRVSASNVINGTGLAPKGERAVFSARGDIFTVPAEDGITRNLTRSPGANDRQPSWSPDGKHVAYVSDADGEDEIWLIDGRGYEAPRQLTDGGRGRLDNLIWSPDNEAIAFINQQSKLFVADVETGEVTEVVDDPEAFGLTYSWAPDGNWLAYDLQSLDTDNRVIWIWQRESGEAKPVTDPHFHAYSPSFGLEGNYLFYLSNREFRPLLDVNEWDFVVDRAAIPYALALRADVDNPFPPKLGDVEVEEEKDDAKKKDGGDKGDAGKKDNGKKDDDAAAEDDDSISIDFDGITSRVARFPVGADNYFGLGAVDGGVLLFTGGVPYYGRSGPIPTRLHYFSLKKREMDSLIDGLYSLALSPDASHMLVGRGGGYHLYPASGGDSKPISMARVEVDRVPTEEWAQIFDEVWRRFRDYFYVANMHGYDWDALRAKYEPLLAHVAHRSDLSYVISEMIAELAVGHAYVAGGDYAEPDRPSAALLGARLEVDEAAGRYRIAKIFAGHNEESDYRSPLTEIGVDVEVGDYLLAINGVELTAADNPYRLLRHAGSQALELTVGDTASLADARRVLVRPIGDEDSLIYLAWTERNRARVAELSDGRVGYLHIPNMGTDGLREFVKWWYPQLSKAGLVIDVRSNGGGNVSPMLIERMSRDLLMVDYERNIDHPETYPASLYIGHLVAVLDEDTASDGDQFAYAFKAAGLGPTVGKRSWGGVVGIYGRDQLMDGGSLSVPEAGTADANGQWAIEGYGVDPDHVVEQDPQAVIAGGDPQLEKSVELVLEAIAADPRSLPERPADPIKTD
ncbi:MAG: S41 family peptidase [Acidobacteriota bacterium]